MKKGLTLIEILVILTIVGILVAVAIPAFNQALHNQKAIELLKTRGYPEAQAQKYVLDLNKITKNVYDTLVANPYLLSTGSSAEASSEGSDQVVTLTWKEYKFLGSIVQLRPQELDAVMAQSQSISREDKAKYFQYSDSNVIYHLRLKINP